MNKKNTLTKWADLSRLQPARDAVEVESVVAHSPGNCTLLVRVVDLVRLTLDA